MGKSRGGRASYREGFTFSVLSFTASMLFGVLSTIAISRAYGVKAIGEFALVNAPIGVAWFLSTVQERPGLIRELVMLEPRAPRVAGLFWAVFAFSFGLTVVVGALVLVGTWFLFNGPIHQPHLFVPAVVNMAGYVLITNTCWNFDIILSSFRAGRQLFWVRQQQALVFFAVGIVLGIANGTVWGLVVATLASYSTALLHRIPVCLRYMPERISFRELRRGFDTLPDIIRFGLRITPGGIADGISGSSSTWVLGIASSVSVVGAFTRAYWIGQRAMELNFRIAEMFLPTLLERRARGDHHGFDRALVDTIRYAAVSMLWPAAAGGGAAAGVMHLFGPGFMRASGALIFTLMMPAACTVSLLQRHVALAVDKPFMTSVSAGIRMAVTLAATVALALAIGATGAALAVVLGLLADSVFMYFVTRRYLATPVRRLWPPRQVLALAVAYGTGFVSAHVVYGVVGGYGGLALALPAGSIAYAVSFVACGGIDGRDRERAVQFLARLRARRADAKTASGVTVEGSVGGNLQPEAPRRRRTVVLVPGLAVLAFGVAFATGHLTRSHNSSAGRLARAASVGQASVSVVGAAAVPAPPALKLQLKPAPPAAPKALRATRAIVSPSTTAAVAIPAVRQTVTPGITPARSVGTGAAGGFGGKPSDGGVGPTTGATSGSGSSSAPTHTGSARAGTERGTGTTSGGG